MVESVFVEGAPQESVLRNREHQAAARAKRPIRFAKHARVVVDVLEHIEGADSVEFFLERQVTRVQLHQGRTTNSLRGPLQSLGEKLTACQVQFRTGIRERGKYIAR